MIKNFCLEGPCFTFLALVFLTQELFNPPPLPGGGGGTQKSFIREGSAPRSNSLPSYIIFSIFDRKYTPIVYFLLTKGSPFIYLIRNLHSFYCCDCTFFKMPVNKSQNPNVFTATKCIC